MVLPASVGARSLSRGSHSSVIPGGNLSGLWILKGILGGLILRQTLEFCFRVGEVVRALRQGLCLGDVVSGMLLAFVDCWRIGCGLFWKLRVCSWKWH